MERTRTPPPNTRSHRQSRHSRVSESLARDRKAPESPKPSENQILLQCGLGFALSGHSKALRTPSPPHLSFTKLCPRNGKSLKGKERAIQSDKLLSNWYSCCGRCSRHHHHHSHHQPTNRNLCLWCISGLPPIKPSTCLARGSRRKGKGALTSDDKHEMLNHNFNTQAAV